MSSAQDTGPCLHRTAYVYFIVSDCVGAGVYVVSTSVPYCFGVQELCESRGGRPGLSVLMSLKVSVDVKQHCTMLRHWSQFVPNISTDIRGHEALHHHHHHIVCEPVWPSAKALGW